MKKYQKVENVQFNAAQFGKDESAKEFVKLCEIDHKGVVKPFPRDLMGIPKNTLNAVNTSDGWRRIEVGDWIVQKDDEILVVPNGVFKLLFIEA